MSLALLLIVLSHHCIGVKVHLSTPNPSGICSTTKVVTIVCKVESDDRGMVWKINSRRSQASIDFTTFLDKPSTVGREGYATASIEEFTYNSLTTTLNITVEEEEIPYNIRCLDPFSTALKEVRVQFREPPKPPENLTIDKVLLQRVYRDVVITWKWESSESIKDVSLSVNPEPRHIKSSLTQATLSLDYMTKYTLEVAGENCAGEGARNKPFTIPITRCKANINIGVKKTLLLKTSISPVCFSCLDASGKRVPDATFFIDFRQVYRSNNAGMLRNQLIVLDLKNVGFEEGKRFKINCENGRTLSSSVLITYPRPVVFQMPNKKTYLPGSELNVTCTNPNQHFIGVPYWTGPDKNRIGNGGTLKFVANKGLQGTYTCQVDKRDNLPFAPGPHSFELVVATPPQLQSTTSIYQEFNKGDDFSLSCSYSGDPLPTLQWTLNSKSIVQSVKTDIKIAELGNGNRRSTLSVTNASPALVGTYKCTSFNVAGSSQFSFTRKLSGNSLNCDSVNKQGEVVITCKHVQSLLGQSTCRLLSLNYFARFPCSPREIKISSLDHPPGSYDLIIDSVDATNEMNKDIININVTEFQLDDLDCTTRSKFRVVHCTTSLDGTKTTLQFRCSYNKQPSVNCGSGPLLPIPDKFYSTDPDATINLGVELTTAYEKQTQFRSFTFYTTTTEVKRVNLGLSCELHRLEYSPIAKIQCHVYRRVNVKSTYCALDGHLLETSSCDDYLYIPLDTAQHDGNLLSIFVVDYDGSDDEFVIPLKTFTITVKAPAQITITESFKYVMLEFYCEGENRKPVYLTIRAVDYDQLAREFPNKYIDYLNVNSIPPNSSYPFEDFDGHPHIVSIPAHANRGGIFHSIVRINVYNDGVVEGDEGFFILFTVDDESVIIKSDIVGIIMMDGESKFQLQNMNAVSKKMLADHAAPSSELVTIVITDKSQSAAVIAGADVKLNFVKFVQDFVKSKRAASYDDVFIEITQQKNSQGDIVVITENVMIAPPHMFQLMLNKVEKEDSGIYTINVCIHKDCVSPSIKLHVIKVKSSIGPGITVLGAGISAAVILFVLIVPGAIIWYKGRHISK